MKRFYIFSFLLVLSLLVLPKLSAQEKYDSATVAQIIDQGMNHSQVMDIESYIADIYGPRLAYSPAFRRAADWAVKELGSMGLDNPHLESWTPMGKSWTLNRYSANIIGAQDWPLISYPKAWSPGTKGTVTGELVYLDSKADTTLEIYKGKLKGKFVMLSDSMDVKAHFDPEGIRDADSTLLKIANADMPQPRGGGRGGMMRNPAFRARMQMDFNKMDLCMKEGALGVLTVSRGDGGNVFVQNASVPLSPDTPDSLRFAAQDPKCPKIPLQISVGAEHYDRLLRMLRKGEKPKLELNLDVTIAKPDSGYDIVAEIPGSDLKDEVVMIGGHFDSWHGGTGAADNGTGSAVCMEAMRILKALDLHPRRTIRIALWDGEEEGLIGSSQYVKAHFGDRPGPAFGAGANSGEITYKPEAEKFDVYFNDDNGSGKFRGVYMQGNEAVRPIFREWLKPFSTMGANTLSLQNTGGTDHLSFDRINLPGFQFIQDELEYGSRTHHSTMDLYERVQPDDMKQSSVIMAAFAYNAAMREEKFPHKPAPKPEPKGNGSN